jgi:DNA polymerase III alpha subunit
MRIRTGYSFKHAIGHIPDAIQRIKETGASVAPISDRMSTFGFNRWAKAAKKEGLRPIFGVELGVVAELGQKKPNISWFTFFAKDSLKPLNELVALATSNTGALLTYEQARASGLIVIAGELSDLSRLKKGDMIALSPAMPKGQYLAAKKKGLKFVACSDNVYPKEDDGEIYKLALGRRANSQSYPQHILSATEWHEAMEWFVPEKDRKAAIAGNKALVNASTAELKQGTMLKPKRPATLRKMCEAGAKKLKINLKDKVYAARLKRELDMIKEKEFEDYFYIIADMVAWAKTKMIVGPARGSSCGSLVCYLLGITTVDPIPFGLIFERFIDVNRIDLPDIDIDFSDEKRHLLFEYMEKKYGQDHVARLGTVMMFKPKSALKQFGETLDIPPWKIEKLTTSIIDRSSGDSRALQAIEDTLKDTEVGRELLAEHPLIVLSGRIEGHPHTAGQHAAGVIVTQHPVTDYLAVDSRVGAVMCDKKDAEELNLLKIDALGLTQLSVFERALELIGSEPVSGFLESIPLDDKKAFEVLNKGQFAGVFQFNGSALQSLASQIKVNHIEDIISITALARPGPMATGGASTWVKRKLGKEKVTYPHELFKPHLEKTLGIVMYQEQVMTIGRDIGDLSWELITELRKAMSRTLGKEYFDRFGNPWKAAAEKKGIPKAVVGKVWDDLCAYGSWAFNRSHSVAYGLVSYWCCWMKAHYPVEFAAATLDAEKDPGNQIKLLRELAAEGIDYRPVDADHSGARWQPVSEGGKKHLVGPLTQIHGIGPAGVKEIVHARKTGEEVRPGLKKKLANGKTKIGSLFPVADTVHRICNGDLSTIGIVSSPKPIKEINTNGSEQEVVIIGILDKLSPKDENEDVNVAKRGYKLTGPIQSVNLFFSDDTDRIFCKINRYDYTRLAPDVLNRGKVKKAIYAIKGKVPRDFRMIQVKQIKYIGDIE